MVNAIAAITGTPVLIIGDMVADVYLDGRISRISREAPVLVLEQMEERVVAGGAANVANNAATLGGTVYAVGVVGRDTSGDRLMQVLGENAVQTGGFVRDAAHPTITKTRIIAGGRATVSQQIATTSCATRASVMSSRTTPSLPRPSDETCARRRTSARRDTNCAAALLPTASSSRAARTA